MARYSYDIAGDYPFLDEEGVEHANDLAAWRYALKSIRDVEDSLHPGGRWSLSVREGKRLVYLIEVTTKIVSSERH